MGTLQHILAVSALAALAQSTPASAAGPTYTFDQPTSCGSWCYDDPGLSKLTDGVSGYAGWAVDNAAPWVGWVRIPSVNVTFQFGQAMHFSAVSVGTTQDYLGDVVLPSLDLWAYQGGNWVLQGSIVTPASSANDNYAYSTAPHQVLMFNGLNVTTDQLRITATPGVPGTWVFVDEVGFQAAAPVPEPASWTMLLAGVGMTAFARRRLQSARQLPPASAAR
jgi:hypothetical protein